MRHLLSVKPTWPRGLHCRTLMQRPHSALGRTMIFFPDANVSSSACCYLLRVIAFKSLTSAQGHSQGPPVKTDPCSVFTASCVSSCHPAPHHPDLFLPISLGLSADEGCDLEEISVPLNLRFCSHNDRSYTNDASRIFF